MTIKTDLIQTGASVTTSQLFTQRAPNDGTFRISRGAAGATTEDNLVIGTTGKLTGTVVQSTPTDATAGSLMTVGAFGLGSSVLAGTADYNAVNVAGFYLMDGTAPTNAPAGWNSRGTLLHYGDISSYALQITGNTNATTNQLALRLGKAGAWSDWVQVMTSATSLGVGQTVQTVTGSRALGVTYTNSTGAPIFVSAAMSLANIGALPIINIAGQIVRGVAAAVAGQGSVVSAIVPIGATYVVTVAGAGGAGTLTTWSELRA